MGQDSRFVLLSINSWHTLYWGRQPVYPIMTDETCKETARRHAWVTPSCDLQTMRIPWSILVRFLAPSLGVEGGHFQAETWPFCWGPQYAKIHRVWLACCSFQPRIAWLQGATVKAVSAWQCFRACFVPWPTCPWGRSGREVNGRS